MSIAKLKWNSELLSNHFNGNGRLIFDHEFESFFNRYRLICAILKMNSYEGYIVIKEMSFSYYPERNECSNAFERNRREFEIYFTEDGNVNISFARRKAKSPQISYDDACFVFEKYNEIIAAMIKKGIIFVDEEADNS